MCHGDGHFYCMGCAQVGNARRSRYDLPDLPGHHQKSVNERARGDRRRRPLRKERARRGIRRCEDHTRRHHEIHRSGRLPLSDRQMTVCSGWMLSPTHPKQTSSRPKQRTVLSSVAQWRDPCISSLFLSLYRATPCLQLWVSPGDALWSRCTPCQRRHIYLFDTCQPPGLLSVAAIRLFQHPLYVRHATDPNDPNRIQTIPTFLSHLRPK